MRIFARFHKRHNQTPKTIGATSRGLFALLACALVLPTSSALAVDTLPPTPIKSIESGRCPYDEENAYTESDLCNPTAIVVNAKGEKYVFDQEWHNLKIYNPDGTYKSHFGGDGDGESEFGYTVSMAFAPNGNLYVADTDNSRIQVFSPDGAFISQFGISGDGTGEFSNPQDLTFAPNGNLYVADTRNDRIQIFSPDGTYLSGFGRDVDDEEPLLVDPSGVAVGPSGEVYVADRMYVNVFTTEGVLKTRWRVEPIVNGMVTLYWMPNKIAVDSNGSLYMSSMTRRVQCDSDDGPCSGITYAKRFIEVFTPNGESLYTFGEDVFSINGPETLTLAPNGELYATNHDGIFAWDMHTVAQPPVDPTEPVTPTNPTSPVTDPLAATGTNIWFILAATIGVLLVGGGALLSRRLRVSHK